MRAAAQHTLLFAFFASLTASPLFAVEPNTLSNAEEQGGWQLLFDGESTDGWRNYRKDSIGDGWQVEDGALVRAAGGAGDIVTQEKYDNFELSIEYKISPEGNSGIMFLVTEDGGAPWHSGPEIQVQDNVDGHDPQKAGWIYELYPGRNPARGQPADATRPVGQWNHIQLRVTEAGCELNLNGHRYARFNVGNDDWIRKVAASKFARFEQFGKAEQGHICLQDHGDWVAYRNIKIRKLPADGSVPNPVSGELPVQVVQAFPNLQWEDWEPVSEQGIARALRPIVLTHGGDGSNRVFVADQWGVIYAFDNDQDVTESKVFLDLRDRVRYLDNNNEEGFLGLAFHPDFAENGELFVYYTTRAEDHTSIISRFHSDGDVADPDSEEEILRIEQPFWNHNGGTIAFGPDGYLYIGLGDGGAGNDPFGNAQSLETWLGSIMRIDVDHTADGNNYAIPADNPFVGRDNALPEIYAIGIRNVWRIAFDRETGHLWAGDVGQNLWEEINIIENGGNYGWSVRESMHPFGPKGADDDVELIDPVWEYDHQVGKSITGGFVYRGENVPALQGKYLYADYVSGLIWALDYDEESGVVRSNQAIPAPSGQYAIISFGEDEQGEAYFTIVSATGKGIFTFAPADE